jgi:hypothetical protein
VRHLIKPLVIFAALSLLASPLQAEDQRGRWSFSLGVGFLSSLDDIRSNAAAAELLAVGRPGDISDDPIINSDPRGDDLLGRETEIEEAQTYNASIAYGLTSWLSLQVDVSYYEGNISNLDTFQIERRFVAIEGDNVFNDEIATPFQDASVPLGIGDLEQIPVMFSAIFRFRKDSPFNPILGAGVGWFFADLNESQAFENLNTTILQGFQRTQIFEEAENLQMIQDVDGVEIVNTDCSLPADRLGRPEQACTKGVAELEALIQDLRDSGINDPGLEEILRQNYEEAINADFIPTRPMVVTRVEDGFAYQLLAGAEYNFNERWSTYFLGRYLVTDAGLEVRITDNGNTLTAVPTDPGIEPVQPVSFELDEAVFRFNARANLEGPLDGGPGRQVNELEDQIYVQGGDINFTSFSLLFGIRYSF